jgi:hypothetical protein
MSWQSISATARTRGRGGAWCAPSRLRCRWGHWRCCPTTPASLPPWHRSSPTLLRVSSGQLAGRPGWGRIGGCQALGRGWNVGKAVVKATLTAPVGLPTFFPNSPLAPTLPLLPHPHPSHHLRRPGWLPGGRVWDAAAQQGCHCAHPGAAGAQHALRRRAVKVQAVPPRGRLLHAQGVAG